MDKDLLRKQLQRVRFEKAIDYINRGSGGQKRLNTQELAQLNNMVRGEEGDPWRNESAVVNIPGGKRASFSVVSNPLISVRNIISNAVQKAANGDIEEAAVDLYSQMVLNHFFKDANRRTAVAATYWLLLEHSIQISAMGLLELGMGDLRSDEQLEHFKKLVKITIEMAKSRG